MSAAASSDRMLTSFPESAPSFQLTETADLLGDLSLNSNTNGEAQETGSKAVHGGNGRYFGQLGTNQVPLLAETTKGSNHGVLPNDATVDKGSNRTKSGYQNSNSNHKGLFTKEGIPTGYYFPGNQYPSGNYGSGKNDLHAYPYARMAAMGQYGYMDNVYSNLAMYGQLLSTLGTSYGYELYGNDSWKQGQGWYPFNNGCKIYGFSGYNGKENVDGLNELNRGPRTNGYKIREGTEATAKEQNISQSENPKGNGCFPDTKEYNREDFPEDYELANFFVIKSYSEDDVHKSIKYNVWSSTPNGNKKLDAAYRKAKEISDGCPVFLLFSVNTSGQFVGLAEMVGPVDFNKTVEYWQQDKWIGCFPVKWHIIKDVPNSSLRHITLENNENKPVTNSRDTQKVHLEQGIKIIKIFKDYSSKISILNDFSFYEARQKLIQERKANQLKFKKQGFEGNPRDVKDKKTETTNQLQKTTETAGSKSEGNGDRKLLKENGTAVTENGVSSNAATAC